jgi:hypothetical protein
MEHYRLPCQDLFFQAPISKKTLSSTQNYGNSLIATGDVQKTSPLSMV